MSKNTYTVIATFDEPVALVNYKGTIIVAGRNTAPHFVTTNGLVPIMSDTHLNGVYDELPTPIK